MGGENVFYLRNEGMVYRLCSDGEICDSSGTVLPVVKRDEIWGNLGKKHERVRDAYCRRVTKVLENALNSCADEVIKNKRDLIAILS